MVMKSIFTVSCFVVMALAIGTEEQKIPAIKLIHLIEAVNTTCRSLSLRNGSVQKVNEVVFEVNCKKEAYQDTFCQVNRALRSCRNCNVSSLLSDFHEDKCTPKRSFIRLKNFCSNMLEYLEKLYRRCADTKWKHD